MSRVLGILAATALLLSACSTAAPPAPAAAPTQAPAAPTAAPAAQPTTAPAAAPAAAATSAPVAAAPAASGGTVKIGVLFPLSGSLGLAGKHNLNGAEIALDELNAAGGWQGKKVEFAVGDAPTTAAAVSEANRLISQEGVKVIIGTVSSSLALAAAPVADRNKIILWELEAVSDDLTNKGLQYVFRTVVPASGLGSAAADYTVKSVAPLMKVDPKSLKIGIIHEDGDYGTSVANAVEKTLTDQGIKPVLRESYNAAKETDFSSLILKLKSAGVDVVIPTSYTSDAILFWKQARQLEYAPKALVGTGAGYTVVDFSDALSNDVNGVVSSSFPVDIKDTGLSADAQATRKAYLDAFKKKFNYEPSVGEEMAYIGTRMLLRDVLPKVTEMDSDKIREAAMAVDKPLGSEINGWGLKFDKNGQNTRAFGNVIQWQDKQMRSVSPEQLSTSTLANLPLPAWNARGSN